MMDEQQRMAEYFYNQPYQDLGGSCHRIHWSTKFGKNVKIGFGTVIEENCEIGDNTIITHNCVIRPNTKIGSNCIIGHGAMFEGDSRIGDRVLIHAQCHITKGIIIEDDVFLGPNVVTGNTKNIKHGRNFDLVLTAPIIRRAVRIGGGVCLTPGVEIGTNAFIGMGAVVTKNVPPGELWLGNPARYFRDIPEDEWL